LRKTLQIQNRFPARLRVNVIQFIRRAALVGTLDHVVADGHDLENAEDILLEDGFVAVFFILFFIIIVEIPQNQPGKLHIDHLQCPRIRKRAGKILIKKPVNLPNMRLRLLRRHRKTADLAAARNIILKLLFHVKSPFLMCGWYAFIIQ